MDKKEQEKIIKYFINSIIIIVSSIKIFVNPIAPHFVLSFIVGTREVGLIFFCYFLPKITHFIVFFFSNLGFFFKKLVFFHIGFAFNFSLFLCVACYQPITACFNPNLLQHVLPLTYYSK